MRYKILTVASCGIGVSSAAYGMLRDNDLIFLIGLIFVIGGYLMIRRRLKQSLQDKEK